MCQFSLLMSVVESGGIEGKIIDSARFLYILGGIEEKIVDSAQNV